MYIGDLQMPSTKIIIPGSKALENVSASFIANKVVAELTFSPPSLRAHCVGKEGDSLLFD